MRKRSGKIFFFSFLFQTLRFFRKIGQSFLCFSDFPKFTKPAKTFKNTSNLSILNFSTSVLGLLVQNQIKHNIYIYIYLFISIIKTFETSSNPCICFYQKIGLEPDLSLAYVPRPLRIKAHVVHFQLYTYTYIHNKIFNIYSMENYIYNEITGVVSLMARLTAPGDALPAHLSRVLKMFLKHTKKNELKEPSECTFSFK